MERLVLRSALALLLCASGLWAQTFAVKGVLRDPLGRTVADGSYKLTLKLYTQAEGGAEVWSEVHGSVQAENGVVSLELGTVNSLSGVGFAQTFWLGITVGNFPEMEPRIKLGTNPYSLAVKGEDNLFPSTGNVGINTLAPTQPLEVNGNAKVTGALIFGDGSSMSSADLGGTASSLANPSTALITADSDQDGGGEIQFLTGASTDMVIANSGNVGIGTAAPANKLSVAGNADISGNVGIGTATPANPLSVVGNADITGRLGIGTAAPTNPLSVAGNADIAGRLAVNHGTIDDNHILIVGGNPSGAVVRLGTIDYGSSTVLSVAPGRTHFDSPGVAGGAMTIDGTNRRVGIGTSTPNVNLAIAGLGSTIELGAGVSDKQGDAGKIGYRLFSNNLDIVGGGSNGQRSIRFWAEQGASFSADLWVAYKCYAGGFETFSDARIKNAQGVSDGQQDLETLRKLKVTDFTYVDVAGQGTRAHKKLIAQQVQEVYPRAVTEGVNFVPSVYQMSSATTFAENLLRITTEKEHGFVAGDTVRLVFGKDHKEHVVRQVADEHTFAVEHPEAVEQVFVWGKKVHDFLSVDYEAVAMLNVSATQELARRVEKLERENASLQAELSRYQALEAENALLKVRMERFEAVLQRLETQQTGQQRAKGVVAEDSGLSMAD